MRRNRTTWYNRIQSNTSPPYEGAEDYIFISYSHRDMQAVLPILYRLRDAGFRFWYDEGIDPGTEWPESIASHLLGCRVFIAFVSGALSRGKDFLTVTLEPTSMTPGMEMQLAPYQSLNKFKYDDEEMFFQRLLSLEPLASCRQPEPGPEPEPVPEQDPEPEQTREPAPGQDPEPEQAQREGGSGRGGHALRNAAAAVAAGAAGFLAGPVAGVPAALLAAALFKSGGEQQDKPSEQDPDAPAGDGK